MKDRIKSDNCKTTNKILIYIVSSVFNIMYVNNSLYY